MIQKIRDLIKYLFTPSKIKDFGDESYKQILIKKLSVLHPIEIESIHLITRSFLLLIYKQLGIATHKGLQKLDNIQYHNMMNQLIEYKNATEIILKSDQMKDHRRHNNSFFLAVNVTIYTMKMIREKNKKNLYIIWKILLDARKQVNNSIIWIRKYETEFNTSLLPYVNEANKYLSDQELIDLNKKLPDFLLKNK